MLLLARVPMARREADIGATTATIVRPWKNPDFVPRTGRHVAAYTSAEFKILEAGRRPAIFRF